MDNRAEVREFLMTRRAKIRPEDAGLPTDGRRRVPGLRRSEVAALAGVSVEYYSRLERGRLAGVSASVLDGLADALRLDWAERSHLVDLARAAGGSSLPDRTRRRPERPWTISPGLQWVLDAMRDAPAIVTNGRSDLLAANHLGRALFAEMLTECPERPNFARFTFLTDTAHRFYPNWEFFADITVAMLHTEAGRSPHDPLLHELVGELSTRSTEFRRRWSAHDVRIHAAGTKEFRHELVGDLTLAYETVDLRHDDGLSMTAYAAEPGSPSDERLHLLASWAAEQSAPARTQPVVT